MADRAIGDRAGLRGAAFPLAVILAPAPGYVTGRRFLVTAPPYMFRIG